MIKQSPAKTKSFLKAINRAAMQKCNEISQQIEQTTKEEMERAEREADRDGHLRIDAAKAGIEAHAKALVAAHEKEKKSEICQKRLRFETIVFEETAQKLIAFTQSAEYPAFLSKSIGEIADRLGESVTVFIKKDDAAALQNIKKLLPQANILSDETIRIGGVKIRDDDLSCLFDCTLDTRLENEKEWFLLHAGLKVEF